MYSIGEFSKISSITVKALRHYHKKGILVPSFSNEETGYRYYSIRDIDTARVIATLKSLQFTLDEIELFLNGMSDDKDTLQALKIKRAKINADIQNLKSVVSVIDSLIYKEHRVAKVQNTAFNIQFKTVSEQLALVLRWQGAYSDTEQAISKLYKAAGRQSAGAAFNLFYDGEFKEDADIESCLPLKKQIYSKFESRILPKQRCVSVVHQGPYETISNSYQAAFDFITSHGLSIKLPTREIYLKGKGIIFKGNPDKYLTEILIPIE